MEKREVLRVEIGDSVSAMGVLAKVAEIEYQDAWNQWDTNERKDTIPAIHIEFTDTNGIYRSWKSYLDGGTLIKADGTRHVMTKGEF